MARCKPKVKSTRDVYVNKKLEYARSLHMGLTCPQAAKRAGLSDSNTGRLNKDEVVVKELKRLQLASVRRTGMTRKKVENIVLEAIQMARLLGDPTAMIRGAQELNKMSGFYAPEKKELTLTDSMKRTVAKFDGMSDEELMMKLGDDSDIIEGELAELTPDDPLDHEALEQMTPPEFDPEDVDDPNDMLENVNAG